MSIELRAKDAAAAGSSVRTVSKFDFAEDTKVWWGGLTLLTNLPCGNELPLATSEIFCEGFLENGTYIRERELPISRRAVPTLIRKNIHYIIKATLSVGRPDRHGEEFKIVAERPIKIRSEQRFEPNPVSLIIKGMSFSIEKDSVLPGEVIKLDYKTEGLKLLTVDLVHDTNINCACPKYAKVCVHIKKNPPEILTTVEEKSPTRGYLSVRIPQYAEHSYNYFWEPTERTHWSQTFGAYSYWYLDVTCTKVTGETIKFQIPINIILPPTGDEGLFEESKAKGIILGKIPPQAIEVLVTQKDKNKLSMHVTNNTKQELKGVTIKVVGIKEELFETASYMLGIKKLPVGKEVELNYKPREKNVQSFQLSLEDNEGNIINKRVKLKS
ncbi:MAG: hypothetical protein ACUVXA_00055 [Candidatus Jordarchaeum sp.]|uniref:hypothetical protein n=1 Tax=Candidatus Jordarchaeum sp. TaxID=2823881 RepID=UPI00404994E7